MAHLQVDSANIYYEKTGDSGPWITLVNGHMRSSRDFRLMRSLFNEVGFRVLVLDNRDSGQSISDEDYDLSDMVDDIYAIWEKEEITSSHLLGISMGGLIAQGVTLSYPAAVESLILISSFADSTWMLKREPEWGSTSEENFQVLQHYVSDSFLTANRRLIEIMAEQTTKDILSAQYLGRAKRQRAATQNVFIGAEQLEKIQCPTQIIHGEKDQIVGPAAANFLHESISGSNLHIIADCGHLLLAEAADELYATCKSFVSKTAH